MHRQLTSSQLSEIVGLSLDELSRLIESGVFPPPRGCAGWNETKVRAWAWGLRNSPKLAANVELVLGYRSDWWATPSRPASQRAVRRFYCSDPIPVIYALVADMPAALSLTQEQFAAVVQNDWTFPETLCTPTGWACRAGEFDRWRAAWTREALLDLINMFGPGE